MNKWRKVRLGDVAKIVGGGTPSTKNPENYGGKIPWITPKDLSSLRQRYIGDGERSITQKGLDSSSAKLLPPNAILFTSRAPIGYIAIAKNELATNQGFKNLMINEENDDLFFYYLLKYMTSKIKSYASGSTFLEINSETLKSIEVNIPEITVQKSIAHILGTLDDKIELNQQMNETLESMAQAIFQDWFIDFGPTRRKMQGATDPDVILGGLFATPEKSREIADLFPSELIESELGKMPQGWDVNTLGQHIFLTKGRSYKRVELQDSDVALVTLKSFLRGGGYRHDGLKSYIGKYKEEQTVEEGDLIIALTDVTQAADVIGKPAIARNSAKYKTLVASLDVGIVRMLEGSQIANIFCYYLMLTARYTSHSLGYTSGTTVLHLSKDAAMNYKFVLPSNELMKKINMIISPLYQNILNSEKENEILFSLFELVLPKLISGKINAPSDQSDLSYVKNK